METFFVIVVIGSIWLFVRWKNLKPLSEKVVNEYLMEEFGETKEERREGIKAHFARDKGKISMLLDVKKPYRCRIFVERNLITVDPLEKFSLETVYHLFNEGFIEDSNFFLVRFGLFYADGQGLDISYEEYRGEAFKCLRADIQELSRYLGMTLVKSVTYALNQLESAYEKHPDNPIYEELHQKYEGGNKLGGGQFDLEHYMTKG